MPFAIPRAVALALVVAGLAGAARAQSSGPAIGYVETLGGAITSAITFNSAGGTNSLAALGTGVYQVTLPGLGNGVNSNVQVNAINTDGRGHYCTADGWGSPNGTDVTADVACFDSTGNPLSADFSLFYQARTSPPPSGAIAFLWANEPDLPQFSVYTPDTAYNYNSTGGVNTVTQENTGIYFAFLPGFKQTGNPQVTAYGGTAARCEVADWYQNRAGTNVVVYCVNAAGVPTNTYFSLSYTSGTTEAAGVTATALGAYAWANNATRKNYVPTKSRQFDGVSAGPLTAQRFGGAEPGQYSLTVPNPSDLSFNTILGMVTAVGSSGEYCNLEEVDVLSFEFYMDVVCYAANGEQADTPYTGTFITSH
jgi:hypothetical protein